VVVSSVGNTRGLSDGGSSIYKGTLPVKWKIELTWRLFSD